MPEPAPASGRRLARGLVSPPLLKRTPLQGQHQRDQREADQIDPLFGRLARSCHFHGGDDIAPGRARLLGQALKTDQIDDFIAAALLKRHESEAKGRRPAGLGRRLERQQPKPIPVIGLPGEMHAHALRRLGSLAADRGCIAGRYSHHYIYLQRVSYLIHFDL